MPAPTAGEWYARLTAAQFADTYIHPVPGSIESTDGTTVFMVQTLTKAVFLGLFNGIPDPATGDAFVTARDGGGRLVGIARGVADGVRGYLTECKLDPARQGPGAVTHIDGRIEHDQFGIAKEMAEKVIKALAELGCERIDAARPLGSHS